MKNLVLIYNFQTSQNQNENFTPAKYGVVYFFSDEGFLPRELLTEMAKSIPEANLSELSFLSLDDLKSFALRVTEETEANQVRLLSVQDFNIGVDGSKGIKSFQNIFQKFGDVIQNPNAKAKKGILGKIFG